MCVLCDKIDSILQVVEEQATLEDWLALVIKMATESGYPQEAIDAIKNDPGNIWMNIISKVAARWMLKKNIPIQLALFTLAQQMSEAYLAPHEGPLTEISEIEMPDDAKVH